MASASRPRPGGGGKMVRPRRRTGQNTPYHRPRSLPNSEERNPSWISRIILSPTRLIATGAGKVLSSVFRPDSSSSSSSSSSGTDSTSEDDVDDVNHDDGLSSLGTDRMNEKNWKSQMIQSFQGKPQPVEWKNHDDGLSSLGTDRMNEKNWKSQMIESFQGKPQPVEWKSETKRVIEQLVMKESFSREECDRLTHIIKSRVIYSPGMANTQEGIQNSTVDSAIIEAQKWLEEKKLGSTSISELDPQTTALLPQVIGSEVGSPVDMAKSYMQSRPPWASQSSKHFKSPLPSAVQLFKEEAPYSMGGSSGSLSKLKRDSPATGSWNILEEIRRVRSKATEMRTPPSSKNDWSRFTSDYKTPPTALFADDVEGGMIGKMHESSKSADVLSLDTGLNTPKGFLGAFLQKTDDGSHNNAMLPDHTFISEKNQDLEPAHLLSGTEGMQDSLQEPPMNSGQSFHPADDIKVVSHSDIGNAAVDGLEDTYGRSQLPSPVVEEAIQGNGSHLKEAASSGASDAFALNGFPSFRSSPFAGIDREQNPAPFNEEQISVDPGPDKEIEGASVKETREILSEASVEVVVVNENDSVAPDSQNSSSLRHDVSFEDLAQLNPKPSLVGRMDSVSQRGRKLSRYNRRGRGRGK